jgi:hypothetical protein
MLWSLYVDAVESLFQHFVACTRITFPSTHIVPYETYNPNDLDFNFGKLGGIDWIHLAQDSNDG